MLQRHHTLPIVLSWENHPDNIFKIDEVEHKALHDSQDLPWKRVRKYRAKMNNILVPNQKFMDLKSDMWCEFFDGAIIQTWLQKSSLLKQINRYKLMIWDTIPWSFWTFEEMVEQLIGVQRDYIARLLRWN